MPLLRMAARTAVVAGTATAVSNRVSRRQYGRWEQQSEAQADEQQQQGGGGQPEQQYAEPAPAAAPPQDELTAKLEQLANLHSQGILTDEEFASAKAKALA
jgi:Short C-terminal domain